MSYNSKYKSSKIEEILDSVGGKQDAIADLDAIRSGAEKGATALQSIPSEYVTETELTAKGYATISALNDKVDKVSGKQLSTEDFTSALKAKLEGLSNYDDTTLSNAISGLETRLNTLVSGDASTAIESFNEIMAFLDGIKDTQDLASIIASIEQQIAAKQDKITDLDTIRSGAAKGATALQSYTEKYTGTITGIKMNGASKGTSGVVDLGTVITAHQDISGKADDTSVVHKTGNETISGAKTFNGGVNFLGSGDSNAVTLSTNTRINVNGTNQTVLGFGSGSFYINHGNYNLLLRGKATRPTYNGADMALYSDIPAAVTESTVSGWGFTKNTGTYSKPSTGIPKSDLASAVQTSLGKADTALQSYTEQYKGTITGVSANGTSVATSGVANIPAASTSAYGVTKLSSATNSTSTSLAATASAVKAAYDLANSYKGTVTSVKINGTTKSPSSGVVDLGTVVTDISGKQDKLVSGTNIKTINGESILGGGDITISGGSSGGEDIRYFTEFTVEDFIEACDTENIITYNTTELFNAMVSNKVICVPYRGYDKGFLVASYRSGKDDSDADMYLQKDGAEYYAHEGDNNSFMGTYPEYNFIQVVEVEAPTGYAQIDCRENRLYKITEPVDIIDTVISEVLKPSIIQFVSGNSGTTINFYGNELLWANGEMPTIEPNTWYEFSVVNTLDSYTVLAVLTPFKPVE